MWTLSDLLVITNEQCQKIEVVSVAPLFGEAIKRIHGRESVSVLFPGN